MKDEFTSYIVKEQKEGDCYNNFLIYSQLEFYFQEFQPCDPIKSSSFQVHLFFLSRI